MLLGEYFDQDLKYKEGISAFNYLVINTNDGLGRVKKQIFCT